MIFSPLSLFVSSSPNPVLKEGNLSKTGRFLQQASRKTAQLSVDIFLIGRELFLLGGTTALATAYTMVHVVVLCCERHSKARIRSYLKKENAWRAVADRVDYTLFYLKTSVGLQRRDQEAYRYLIRLYELAGIKIPPELLIQEEKRGFLGTFLDNVSIEIRRLSTHHPILLGLTVAVITYQLLTVAVIANEIFDRYLRSISTLPRKEHWKDMQVEHIEPEIEKVDGTERKNTIQQSPLHFISSLLLGSKGNYTLGGMEIQFESKADENIRIDHILSMRYLTVFVHEWGHAIASYLLHREPGHQIRVYKDGSGSFQPITYDLSPLGEKVGAVASKCLTYLAGPIFESLTPIAKSFLGAKVMTRVDAKTSPFLVIPFFSFLIGSMGKNLADILKYAYRSSIAQDNGDFGSIAKHGSMALTASWIALSVPLTFNVYHSLRTILIPFDKYCFSYLNQRFPLFLPSNTHSVPTTNPDPEPSKDEFSFDNAPTSPDKNRKNYHDKEIKWMKQ